MPSSRLRFPARARRNVAHGIVPIALFALFAFLACGDDPVAPPPPPEVDRPKNLTITAGATQVTLAWSAPDSIVATTKYKLVRRLNTAPTGPDDANATVVYDGSQLTVAEDLTQFLPDLTGSPHRYFYAVFGCSAANQCETAGARADFAHSVNAPTNLMTTVNANRVTVAWSAPATVGATTNYKLLRRLNTAPSGPNDANATVVYEGSALTVTEDLTQFLPDLAGSPHLYFYTVFGCTATNQCETEGARRIFAPSLVQCLQGGGYTIFWRHANATVCLDNLNLGTAATTTLPNWWRVCATVCVPDTTPRQISDAGRSEATVIGQQMDRLAVPFGRVLSSEFCRCLTTAQLANLGPAIEEAQELTYYVYDEANRCANTFALLGQLPSPGANTALFSHVGFPGCPLGDLTQAECAIYKPDGTGAVTFITRVAWNAWASL